MRLTFHAIADPPEGSAFQRMAQALWPGYRRWYLQQGVANRPTYRDCRQALHAHMPELLPTWERLVELGGGGDLFARFLSLWEPPAYLSACSQAVWPGPEPLLVRNYDYTTAGFDAVCLRTAWEGRHVMGTSDCLIGLVDGVNDAGLVVSLTFGGLREVGSGFGMPIILRYLLQTCATTPEAMAVLARVPSHMAYNVTVVDTERRVQTAQLAPGVPALITHAPVATNHQSRGQWQAHARMTATVEREQYLLRRLMLHEDSAEHFIGAFLRPPLYSLAFDRGFGTLYTASYCARPRTMAYRWPHYAWELSLHGFEPSQRIIDYPVAEPPTPV